MTAPRLAYNHSASVGSGDGCATSSGSTVAGLAFTSSASTYPTAYRDALFFADHNRNCIWTMFAGADGLPSASSVQLLMSGGSSPVDLEIGPGGDLFYAGFDGGDVRRISYPTTNRAPTAVAQATPTTGSAPLSVSFDGTGSSDPDPSDTLTYAWDLDGDTGCHPHQLQTFAGASGSLAAPDHEYPSYLELTLTATDSRGLTDTQTVRLDPWTVQLMLTSNPSGMTLSLNAANAATSFTRTVIEGSSNSLSATDQVRNKSSWAFQSWSDLGAKTHNIVANTSTTYTARFKQR